VSDRPGHCEALGRQVSAPHLDSRAALWPNSRVSRRVRADCRLGVNRFISLKIVPDNPIVCTPLPFDVNHILIIDGESLNIRVITV